MFGRLEIKLLRPFNPNDFPMSDLSDDEWEDIQEAIDGPKPDLTWEGEIYTRPLGRGVSLNALGDGPDIYLDDLIEELVPAYHYATMAITVNVSNLRHQDDEPASPGNKPNV